MSMPSWEGSCHCGAVRFTVEDTLEDIVDCNCSICTQKGFLHVIVPQDRFHLLTPMEALTEYTFGTGVAKHLFCKRCGVHPFYRPRSHPDGISVNARCLVGIDLSTLPVRPFDGQNWEASVGDLRGE